jgi:hypothetical protein
MPKATPPKLSPPELSSPELSPLNVEVYARLEALLGQEKSPNNLNAILRLLAKWRANVVTNTLQKKSGQMVLTGPFKGMIYGAAASEGSTSARLLGGYEAALHPIIEKITKRGYRQIIDVGCAEGYYAVGLAMRMPEARVIARDLNEVARAKCAQLADANGVSAQIEIGGELGHSDFDICTRAKTLVICDIEGAEAQLLDPARAQGLASADILVEVHDCFTPGLSAQIAQRFERTHKVRQIERSLPVTPLPLWMDTLSDLDRLIALWEWRMGPTPWLWMTRKGKSSDKE